jgi:hypothetical protein
MIGGFTYLTDSRHNGNKGVTPICDYISITTWKAKLPQAAASLSNFFPQGKMQSFSMKYFLAIAIYIALEYTAAFEIYCMNT